MLSLEGRHPQAARAFVHAAAPGSLTLALQRPLRAGLLQQGQVRRGRGAGIRAGCAEGGLRAECVAMPIYLEDCLTTKDEQIANANAIMQAVSGFREWGLRLRAYV